MKKEKIIIHILDDDAYIQLCMEEYGNTLKQAINTHAFTDGVDMYLRSSRKPDIFLSDSYTKELMLKRRKLEVVFSFKLDEFYMKFLEINF